eukprot:CAMPEP_0175039426 /NCGR_PEP_ID=MMETSP0052_2-20121109/572_1 /TAXON_ID=51329 ORGANISM="Polytomella parva, Strain SAG 63-3" /NCGR_SAMPLE_ID=MMETSP0052_2 /ASSEMBLY_ACC=CAM_ASM_000194 /LENGTH=138 /DNA_ID=CAMNT_0016301267 /DNA_START=317 /DNA_END=730 /DNA_ORIENTATION=+
MPDGYTLIKCLEEYNSTSRSDPDVRGGGVMLVVVVVVVVMLFVAMWVDDNEASMAAFTATASVADFDRSEMVRTVASRFSDPFSTTPSPLPLLPIPLSFPAFAGPKKGPWSSATLGRIDSAKDEEVEASRPMDAAKPW